MDSRTFIHTTAVVDDGARLGSGSKVWHFTHISADCEIGSNCNIGQNVYIADGVKLGNNCKVQNNVSIYTGVICEDEVFLGPSMVFTNVLNPRSAVVRKSQYKPTIVRKGATIGANATIVCGNELGPFSLVAAGSVVTKDVKAYELVMGVPAQHKGWVSAHGLRLIFNESNVATCSETGVVYILENGTVKLK